MSFKKYQKISLLQNICQSLFIFCVYLTINLNWCNLVVTGYFLTQFIHVDMVRRISNDLMEVYRMNVRMSEVPGHITDFKKLRQNTQVKKTKLEFSRKHLNRIKQ